MATQTTIHETTSSQVSKEDKPYLVVFQILDFILFLIEGFLLMDFALLAAGANRGAGLFQFVNGISSVLMAPFRYLFPITQASGSVIDWSILVAMVVYGLVFMAIKKGIAVVYTADTA